MPFRVPAVVAVLTVLAAAAENCVSAQPVAPQRPRSSAFGNLFGPGSQAVPNFGPGGAFGFNQGNNIPLGPNVVGGLGAQQLGPNNTPVVPLYVFPGQPVVFNNLGHYYGSNNLGHWYPGGFTNGAGVLTGSNFGGANRMGGVQGGGLYGGNAFGAGLYTGAATTGVVAGFRVGGGGGRSGNRR